MRRARWLLPLLAVAIAACVVLAHRPVLRAQAIFVDDHQYVTDNRLVQQPSVSSAWQFLVEVLDPSTVHGYYQPLAMISLMIDDALGGKAEDLGPFHRTSLLLHAANAVGFFFLLYLLLGDLWAAAAAALLFGVHPITVESVAWISERKTVLATFFAIISMICYVAYVRRTGSSVRAAYVACCVAFALALLAKPTTTPLPLLLLVLDGWPLRRLSRQAVIEKIPLLVLAAASAFVTCASQARTGVAVAPGEGAHAAGTVPLIVCHNLIFYLGKITWPAGLCPHYPYPQPLDLTQPMVLAGVVGTILLIVLLAVSLRWTRAVAASGLLFFVAVFPTLGVIGFTNVIASDKYVYLPLFGMLLLVTWLLDRACRTASLSSSQRVRRAVALTAVVLVLAFAEARTTRRCAARWRDTESLCNYILDMYPRAVPPRYALATALAKHGRTAEAVAQYEQALSISPNDAQVHNNLGNALETVGDVAGAQAHYEAALRAEPGYERAHYNLGSLLLTQGKLGPALQHLEAAVRLKPDYARAQNNLAAALFQSGRPGEAISHLEAAVRLQPGNAFRRANLARALMEQRRYGEAVAHYQRLLAGNPRDRESLANLSLALTETRQYEAAIRVIRDWIRLEPDDAGAFAALGRCLEQQGETAKAAEAYRQAADAAPEDEVLRQKAESMQRPTSRQD